MPNPVTKTLLFVVCPVAIAYGSWALSDYSYRPCNQGEVVTDLNDAAGVMQLPEFSHAGDECSTLVLIYHPHCPCTAATVRNLERLNSSFSVRPQIVAFGYCPPGNPDSWINSPITDHLIRLGAEVVVDRAADYCQQLGVITSGHVLLYGDNKQLLFSGGITPGRGHEGSCPASTHLLKSVNELSSEPSQWPVYGCPIVARENSSQ